MAEPKALQERRRHASLKVLVAVATVTLLVGGAYYMHSGGDSDQLESKGELTYEVKRGDLRVSFTERGNVKALKSVQVYSHLEGNHTIVNLVAEGVTVKEGDVLVELDASEITQLLNQKQIQVETADSDVLHASEQLAGPHSGRA
jgi:multidrug efflux pump subunit AcrA (membrane-fusion protein)